MAIKIKREKTCQTKLCSEPSLEMSLSNRMKDEQRKACTGSMTICTAPTISPMWYDVGGWWLNLPYMYRRFGFPLATIGGKEDQQLYLQRHRPQTDRKSPAWDLILAPCCPFTPQLPQVVE